MSARPRAVPTGLRPAGGEGGIAAPELALPFGAPLLVGLVDTGNRASTHMRLAAAARAGTQLALNGPATPARLAEVRAAVEAAAPPAAGARDLRVDLRCECPGGAAVGCAATCPGGPRAAFLDIEIDQPVRFLLPWPGLGAETRIAYATVARLY